MLRLFLLIAAFILTFSNAVFAQECVLHILKKDSTEVHGLPLYTGEDAVLVLLYPIRLCRKGCTEQDTLEALRNAVRIQFSDVLRCELERSSNNWLAGFPGLMVAGLLIGAAFESSESDDGSFFGSYFFTNIGGLMGILVGIPAAIAFHYIYGSDRDIDVTDPEDLAALAKYSAYQHAPQRVTGER